MDWQDDGFILGARRHGESSLILEVMTREHGRHLGLVKGGRSPRLAPMLQPGNAVVVRWRARLEEHLGFFSVEATQLRAAELMTRPLSLHGLNLLAGLLRFAAEREPHESLFALADGILDELADGRTADAVLVRFELALLAASGFGLDLTSCAATGQVEDLAWVSPRSSRAVSRAAGLPYANKLLPLPAFLHLDETGREPPVADEILAGFALTGFFLHRDLAAPRNLVLPAARDAYLALLREGRRTA